MLRNLVFAAMWGFPLLLSFGISFRTIAADIDNRRVYSYMNAVTFYQNHEIDAAIKLLLIEKKTVPEHPLKNEINFLLAICYWESENWIFALRYLDALKNFDSLTDYITFFKARALFETGKPGNSLKLFEELISSYPKSIWFNTSLKNAFFLHYLKKDYKKAINLFKKYRLDRRSYPEKEKNQLPEMLFSYAKCNMQHGRKREAFTYFKKLAINYPESTYSGQAREILSKNRQRFSHSELRRLASVQIKKDLYQEARRTIAHMQKRKVQKTVLATLKADLHTETREWDKAIDTLRSVLSNRSPPKMLYDLAKCYSKIDNYPQARYYYRKLVSIYPQHNLATASLFLTGRLYSIEGNYLEAVHQYDRLLSKYPRSQLASSALWEKGWNHYSHGNYDEAILIWTSATDKLEKTDILVSKLLYWRARAFLHQGDVRSSSILFREIVQRFPFHYYAFQAQNRLVETTPANLDLIHEIQANLYNLVKSSKNVSCKNIDLEVFKNDLSRDEKYYFLKAQNLMKVGLDKYASHELLRIQNSSKNRNVLFNLSMFFHCIHDYNKAQYVARVFFENKLDGPPEKENLILWKLAFPKGYSNIILKLSDYLNVSPYLIFAIMRAESNFNPHALSRAGAIGLMQIMANTGTQIARKIKDRNFEPGDLYNPKTNITFGTWYINSLIGKFDGNAILAVPAYNAGPHNVRRWVRQFGSRDVDEFIETIPYNETRNYVKRVIRNYGVYRTLYSKNKTILRLTRTLQIDKSKLRIPAGQNEFTEDWNEYKESEDPRPRIFFMNKFSLDKLSLIEYFSLGSFKKHVKSRRF